MKPIFARIAALPLLFPAALALATAVAVPACTSSSFGSITSSAQQSQNIANANSLTVESRNGTIQLVRDETATELQVKAMIRCGGATKEEADKRLAGSKLVVDRKPDGSVSVSVTYPPRDNGSAYASNDGAAIEIRAANLNGINLTTSNGAISCDGFAGALNARSSNGGIKVKNHNGPVQVDTSNGAIDAIGVAGPAQLETSNGAIDVSLADGSSQNVTARTSNASMKVALPASWNGTMSAKTSNGRVTVKSDGSRATNVEASRGSGSATIGNGNATATLRTSNGSVLVTVKDSAQAGAAAN